MKKILLSLLLTFSISVADIVSWSDGLITASTESAGYAKSQTRGYYTLGSAKIKLGNQGNFALAHIEMPRLTVGCGGIDATFGGFSFLKDSKYLMKKLEAIGSATAAYLFKMAISTMCKDCSEIMDALENVSQSVNAFNLNTCSIGKTVADKSMNFFTDARQNNLESGATNDPVGQRAESNTNVYANYINGIAVKIGGAGGSPADAKKMVDEKAGIGSFLVRAIKDGDKTTVYSSAFWGTDAASNEGKMLGVIRYLIGDMIGYVSVSDGSIRYRVIPSAGDVDKVLESLVYGDNIQYKTFIAPNDVTAKSLSIVGGLNKIYQDYLITIVTKMRSFQALDPTDRKFIRQQPIPIYKVLNIVAIQNNNDLLDQAAEQLALRQAMAIINHILWVAGTDLSAELQRTSDKQSSEQITNLRVIIDNIQKVKILAQSMMSDKMKDFEQKTLFMEVVRDYEQQIKLQSQSQLLHMMDSF